MLRKEEPWRLAPIRDLNDFLFDGRFDWPKEERWGHRMRKNLLYYESNYLLLFAAYNVCVAPWSISLGQLTLAVVVAVQWKNLLLWLALFAVYDVCVAPWSVFLGQLIPAVVVAAHASLRLRDWNNKVRVWVEKKRDKNQPSTPMQIIFSKYDEIVDAFRAGQALGVEAYELQKTMETQARLQAGDVQNMSEAGRAGQAVAFEAYLKTMETQDRLPAGDGQTAAEAYELQKTMETQARLQAADVQNMSEAGRISEEFAARMDQRCAKQERRSVAVHASLRDWKNRFGVWVDKKRNKNEYDQIVASGRAGQAVAVAVETYRKTMETQARLRAGDVQNMSEAGRISEEFAARMAQALNE